MRQMINAPISVVIPCFNCCATIDRAFDSIRNQTTLPSEIIFVDDASSDQTVVHLREIEQRFPEWVKVISLKKNMGAANARNVGWDKSSEKFIAFLDADDSWHPEKIRIQYEFMLKNPSLAISGHQCLFLSDISSISVVLNSAFRVTPIDIKNLLFKNAFSTPTVMLRRDLKFRFFMGKRYAEDVLLWQQVSSAGLQIVRIELPLAFVHKGFYGVGGLSSHLWAMEIGELENFQLLYRDKKISFLLMVISSGFSILKFSRRLFVSLIRKSPWAAY